MCLISQSLEFLNNGVFLAVAVLYCLRPLHCVKGNYKGPSVHLNWTKAKADGYQRQIFFLCLFEIEW